MKLAYAPYMLEFKRPAGTSRGVLTQKPTCFIKVWDEADPSCYGIGEAALFPGLSPECGDRFGYKMLELLANVNLGRPTDLSEFSSIQYGFEQALHNFATKAHMQSDEPSPLYFPSKFTSHDSTDSIIINGLIWMGDIDFMAEQIEAKVNAGFRCIKLKIGSLDWEREMEMIRLVRSMPGGDDITLRVDANGAFTAENVRKRLSQLADYGVHSIEQPVKPSELQLLSELCADTPVPIALDESLIGVDSTADKEKLLDTVMPQYIILKPALCGAFSGAEEWISLAERRNIGWWVTSALESNIGLNALAQWTATLGVTMPQGLGTGALYTNNLPSPLQLNGEHLRFTGWTEDPQPIFDSLDWRE